MLAIQLLGAARLSHSNHQPIQLRRRARLLLFYIAAHEHPVSREHCTALLWPDATADAARQLLRTSLHQIKVACGDVINSQQQYLALHPDVYVDVREIRAFRAGNPAIDQLSIDPPGLFCTDVGQSDSADFDLWVEAERQRWQQRLGELFFGQAQWHHTHGRLTVALTHCQVALHYAPLREDIVQFGMRLHYATNDRAGAIARYEHLSQALDDQLGVPPMPATQELYDLIITDRLPTSSTPAPIVTVPTSSIPETEAHVTQLFVGRHAELTRLHQLPWDGRVVAIVGEPGIGKSALAHEFLRQNQHVHTIYVSAFAGDQHLPYHAVIGPMRQFMQHPACRATMQQAVLAPIWQAELRRLWPELPGDAPSELPAEGGELRVPEAVAQLLEILCQGQRLVILLDDAGWIDEASLRLYRAMQRRGMNMPWMVMLTLRHSDDTTTLQPLIQQAERSQRLTRVALAPLDTHEVHTLVTHINPHVSRSVIARAEGNPFMLVELLRQPEDIRLPAAISELVQTRLKGLSDDCRSMLTAAAVSGRDFAIHEIRQLSNLDDDRLLRAIDEARQHGIIHFIDGQTGRFDHALTVESINHATGAIRSARLHRALADLLMASHPPPYARITTHLLAAGDTAQVPAHAIAAARDAHQLGAWHTAEYYMRIGIQYLPVHQQASHWLELGEMLFMAGNERASIDALQHAIAIDESPNGRIADQARIALARSCIPAARYDEAIELSEPLMTHDDPDVAMHAAFVCGTAYSLLGEQLTRAQECLAIAETLCRAHHHNDVLPRILFEQAGILAQQGQLEDAVSRYRDALHAAEQSPSASGHTWRILAHNNLGYHLHLLGDHHEALRHVRLGFRFAERFGQRMIQSYLYSTSGEISLAHGDYLTAEQQFRDGLVIAEHYGMQERIAGLTANLGLVAQTRGEDDLARMLFAQALQQADALGVHHLATQIRIWIIPLLPAAQAQQRFQEAWTLAQHSGRSRLLQQLRDIAPPV